MVVQSCSFRGWRTRTSRALSAKNNRLGFPTARIGFYAKFLERPCLLSIRNSCCYKLAIVPSSPRHGYRYTLQ
jgi:hypothetical protein